MTNWKAGGENYLPVLAATEDKYAIPRDLLARMAFQECSWREEVINYAVKSSAGAIGIMQLIPRFFPAAGLSWQSDVDIAGREVASTAWDSTTPSIQKKAGCLTFHRSTFKSPPT